MGEILAFILSSAVIRTFIEGLALKVIAEFLHRRATDPAFLSNSDAAFSKLASASTDQDKQNALLDLQKLMSSG